jgi:phosphatidylserine/phosphatidylglycerophosphate/cardiolipin synthase-like enzyme
MRIRVRNGSFSVHAIAGTYVVLLGIDADAAALPGLLGFAIEREDRTENERYFLTGYKTFRETGEGIPPGIPVSTRDFPVQAFLWGDYTTKPSHDYVYHIHPVYGAPKRLDLRPPVTVAVHTGRPENDGHAVWFNRGVAASQAYARKFRNADPRTVPDRKAWIWLSRGLEEALLGFIRDTQAGDQIRGAFYEFRYVPVLQAFKQALDRGVDVKIVYDARTPETATPNERAIEQAGLPGSACIPRRRNPSFIAHNKFMVRVRNGQPDRVWTGSTNLTEGGIFGQSNVGHLVRDAAVAATFLGYWEELRTDPEAAALRRWTDPRPPTPALDPLELPASGTTAFFSPRRGLDQLDWYTELMDSAQRAVFLTAAFGVNDRFEERIGADKDYLRYLLLERASSGEIEVFRRDADTRFAIGGALTQGGLGRWTEEKLTDLNGHVKFIHTKYMLIDPLGPDPVVITGSVNFSNASTSNNDENMLVIRGDTGVADLYLGEFMRLFNHFSFRDYLQDYRDPIDAPPETERTPGRQRLFLTTDESWARPYFIPDTSRWKERTMFA